MVLAIIPTSEALLTSIVQFMGSAPPLAAWSEIRKHLHEWSPDGRMIRARDEIMNEFWSEAWQLLRANAQASKELREEVAQRFASHEAMGVLVNFCEDAYREPIDERRKMLSHAAAGLTNASLNVSEYARIWRTLGELDPSDIDTLYALWLVPTRLFPGTFGGGEAQYAELQRRGGDALEACNAVAVRVRAGAGVAGTSFVEITRTGLLLLTGLRSFIFSRQRPRAIPGHDIDGARSEFEARTILAAAPGLASLAATYCNHRFQSWPVQFDGVGSGAAPNARSKLVVRGLKAKDADELAAALPANTDSSGLVGDRISVDLCQPFHSEEMNLREIHIAGPFDVMRWLAYDVNAAWA